MARASWTYMLRLLRRNPDRIRMDRLAEYMREFAKLLGTENHPTFRGVRKASTGIKAAIPASHQHAANIRLRAARAVPDSKGASALRAIETMMAEDRIQCAEMQDASKRVLFRLEAPAVNDPVEAQIYQSGTVDGTITGIIGADDTMHLYLRDHLDRDLRLVVRSEEMARQILAHFRRGTVRVAVHGTWVRTEQGWIPDTNKCTVDRFESLEDMSPIAIFEAMRAVPGNGWADLPDADAAWRELRGIQ